MAVSNVSPSTPSSSTSLSAEAEAHLEYLEERSYNVSNKGLEAGWEEDTFEQFVTVIRTACEMSTSEADIYCQAYVQGLERTETFSMFLDRVLTLPTSN